MPLLRQDQAAISVTVTGVALPFIKSWTMLEGGDVEAEDTKTRPGGMLPQVNLGGPSSRSDCTVTRNYSAALHPYIVQLENVAGRAAMKVAYTILDANGVPSGPTVTMTGILKTVTRPNFDANATGAAFLSLVMGANVASSISN